MSAVQLTGNLGEQKRAAAPEGQPPCLKMFLNEVYRNHPEHGKDRD